MYEYIGERIKRARESRGLSQKLLGVKLGLSDKAISSYESARTVPPIETMYKIAKELKKPISFFLESEEDDASLLERIDRIEKSIGGFVEDLQTVKQILKGIEDNNEQDPNLPPVTVPVEDI